MPNCNMSCLERDDPGREDCSICPENKVDEATETTRPLVQLERIVVPPGAEPIGTPPRSWRMRAGVPINVGELKALLDGAKDDWPIMVRNGPRPVFYAHFWNGQFYLELD